MLGILKNIFGSGDVISKGMDLIDDIHTSDVEMVEAKAAAKTELMKSYAPFKIAQRYLALMFGLTFVGCFWICMTLVFMSKPIDDVITLLDAFSIDIIMGTIVGFYFMGGAAEGVINRVKKK